MTIYVLSVDGGGIRGIIPAKILEEIENRAGKPICQIFDLMAGTSTGGIVVAGLCKKNSEGNPQYSARDLTNLYLQYGSHIFNSSFMRQSVMSLVACTKYSCQNLESVLDQYFGDSTLEDTLSELLVTSYDIKNNSPFFFKSWHKDAKSIKLSDVCRATSAAPTYFEPKVMNIDKTERMLIDGAVFACNPAACAYASAKKYFGDDDIYLLSIGTGKVSIKVKNKRRGALFWINPLLHVVFDSNLDVVNYQLSNILNDKYVRIQSELKMASGKLDNVQPNNIEQLLQEAEAMIENNQEAIDMFCHIKRKL